MNKLFIQKGKLSRCFLTAFFLFTMFSLANAFKIEKSQVVVHSKKQFAFDTPPLIYAGVPNNQLVSINYSRFVPSGASRACFIIWSTVGDASGGVFWVKLQSDYDFHLTGNRARNAAALTDNIQQFCLNIGSERNLILTVNGITGANAWFYVYYAGYFK